VTNRTGWLLPNFKTETFSTLWLFEPMTRNSATDLEESCLRSKMHLPTELPTLWEKHWILLLLSIDQVTGRSLAWAQTSGFHVILITVLRYLSLSLPPYSLQVGLTLGSISRQEKGTCDILSRPFATPQTSPKTSSSRLGGCCIYAPVLLAVKLHHTLYYHEKYDNCQAPFLWIIGRSYEHVKNMFQTPASLWTCACLVAQLGFLLQ
jgi:hypothetical protein